MPKKLSKAACRKVRYGFREPEGLLLRNGQSGDWYLHEAVLRKIDVEYEHLLLSANSFGEILVGRSSPFFSSCI